jgi:RNA polymerase sigma-70 factor (ECF subfamily)
VGDHLKNVHISPKSLYKFPILGVYLDENVSNGLERDWCERLYDEKAAQLLLYGRALGLSHSEAEDVLQETFLALMQRADPPLQPEHYCLRSYRNRALNYRRSLWRRITRELESKDWFDRSADESPLEPTAMRCLKRLPLDQREVIVLKIWHQYTFEEIAELLEIPASTAAGRFRYGLQKVRDAMRQAIYEHHEHHESIGEGFARLGATPAIRKS